MKSPSPPNPKKTAEAQAQMNKETATTQAELNMTNQITPQGTLTYNPIGKSESGNPRYEAVTTLSPEQQRLYDVNTATEERIGNIGYEQAGRIGGLLGSPVDLSNEATESRLFELGRKRLDPYFDQQRNTLETNLSNRGLALGDEAWRRSTEQFDQGRNDAYNQLLLSGRGQSVQEALTARNQPINEITALLSGSQVSMPQFGSTPQTGVSGVDYAGLVNQQYQQQLAQQNAQMGGLFGLGGSLLQAGGMAAGGLGGWGAAATPLLFSDRRLKENIREVGRLDNGLPVYSFNFAGSKQTTIGLMADDVEKVRPEAVAIIDGYKAVDYAMATE